MAKGLEKHQERQRQLSLFGKDLTRRARSCCELCGTSGAKLSIYELAPVPQEPEFQRCLFLCGSCTEPLNSPKKLAPDYWRFLSEAIWSEIPIVQVLAARILDYIGRKESWASEILEEAYLDEEIVDRLKEQSL